MPFASLTSVRVEIADHVALVTMDSPPVNAYSLALCQELTVVFDTLSDLPEVRAIVLTGAGRVFCAGADLKGRAGLAEAGAMPAHSRRTRESFHAIRECAKPVICAINGPALGSGLGLAASCDILFAAETGALGLPEIDVGLLGGTKHAQRLFSHSVLRRMVLTGYRVRGPELYRLGVVEACLPATELLPAAMDMARSVASKAPLATAMAKHTANTIEDMSLRDGYRYEQDMTAIISRSEDAQEAKRAFVEKRPPVFLGR